jgi:lysine 2,3-aminomutase
MAGQIEGIFKEKFSPFLLKKLEEARQKDGPSSAVVRVIESQYLKNPLEDVTLSEDERRRHYEADMHIEYEGKKLRGLERLYRRVVLIEPTTVCAAHCRWCLRGQYPIASLTEDELLTIARYCGDSKVSGELREVLVTGGDPFMVPDRLDFLIDSLAQHAPNIKIVRIGSRVPIHDPERVNDALLHALRKREGLRIELGTHVNHATELFPEVRAAYQRLRDNGVVIYNQSVLLKGVNDTSQELMDLFDGLRYTGIETHYLFHCIPMRGMNHHRTSLEKGLRLIREITSSGDISGRCKPMFTAMTDLGKITLYEGVILKREGHRVLLQSHYSYEDRVRWNPLWQKPESVLIDKDGYMQVWYLDSPDEKGGGKK